MKQKHFPKQEVLKVLKLHFFFIYFILIHQKVTTVQILLYVSSKPLLISSILIFEVISVSISLRPSIYQSTIIGTSVLPRIPPNAETFHVCPCHKLKWSGTNLLTSLAKPIITLWTQPFWAHSKALRITFVYG